MAFPRRLFHRIGRSLVAEDRQRKRNLSLETLEPRLALDSHGFTRPQLERTTTVRIDSSVGPQPMIFTKSELVGPETNSFVIASVAKGTVVEKWDQATASWRDVSTAPTTSNPIEILRLLQNRLIQRGDQLRWISQTAGSEPGDSFAIIGWDDGSPSIPPNPDVLPGAIQDVLSQSNTDGEITVSWSQVASANPTSHYIVTKDNGLSEEIVVTNETTIDFTNLLSGDYTFTVSAANSSGAGNAASVTQSLLTYSDLVQEFQNSSLETGNPAFVRYGAHTPEGADAIDLYRIAVDVMKSLPNSHPFSWGVQAGIHGTFWTTVQTLKQGMIDEGFMTEEEANEAFSSWEVVLNNCNHWAKIWAEAQGVDPSQPTQDFHVVFIAWHRLYIAAFEKVVRQVLINEKADSNSRFAVELRDADVENWALPYWDYRTPENSALPQGFRNREFGDRTNSLYTKIRGADINAGVPLSITPMPEGDLGAVPVPGNSQDGISVTEYFNQSVALQQAQTLFTQFNSLAEISPHGVAHDVIGGMADSAPPRISNWIAMVDLANSEGFETLWESNVIPSDSGETLQKAIDDGSYGNVYNFINDNYSDNVTAITDIIDESPYLRKFFGQSAAIAPSLMGWVPTAGRDPIFFLHHAYVDKLWTEYNTLPTSAYLQQSVLDIAGWNFTFWESDTNGNPILQTYSTWNNAGYLEPGAENVTSSKVLQAVYYPNYTYDIVEPLDSNYVPLPKTSNSALALLENPIFATTLNTVRPDARSSDPGEQNTIEDLAFNTIDLELPLTAGLINQLSSTETDPEDIRVAVSIVVETPMNASENIGVVVGDSAFLTENAGQIQAYWNSWNVNAGTGNRDGSFTPDESFRLVDLNEVLLSHGDSKQAIGNLQLARFNPLAMSSTSMPGMAMTTHYSADISFPVSQQFAFSNAIFEEGRQRVIIKDDSQLGVMVLSTTPSSIANQNTVISEIRTSLHQNITVGNIGSDVDAMTYLITNPAIINNPLAITNTLAWAEIHTPGAATYYDRAIDLACVYLATNQDLIATYQSNPLSAISQYLDQGLSEGRSLDGWLRTGTIAEARDVVFAGL